MNIRTLAFFFVLSIYNFHDIKLPFALNPLPHFPNNDTFQMLTPTFHITNPGVSLQKAKSEEVPSTSSEGSTSPVRRRALIRQCASVEPLQQEQASPKRLRPRSRLENLRNFFPKHLRSVTVSPSKIRSETMHSLHNLHSITVATVAEPGLLKKSISEFVIGCEFCSKFFLLTTKTSLEVYFTFNFQIGK